MKILFAGTPEIAVPSLYAIANKFPIAGVLTAPDKASGRGKKMKFSPIKTAAMDLCLPVIQPQQLDSTARDAISEWRCELLVVFAYGRIFGPKFLALFPMGGINMHPSALPRYRGPSPLTATILNGDSESAMTVQRIALEMDAGNIIRQTPFSLDGTETTGSLTNKISKRAADELVTVLNDMVVGKVNDLPQDNSLASYCQMISKEDGIIDWQRSAVELERIVRACQPWPKAQTKMAGTDIAILESCLASPKKMEWVPPGTVLGTDKSQGILVQTGNGVLGLKRLQTAYKKPLDFKSFLNGNTIAPGMRFG